MFQARGADVAVAGAAIVALAIGKEQTMREQMQTRLEALRKEFETGQAELEKVERHRTYLREMMLRISGAIQVLEELLTQGQPAGVGGFGEATFRWSQTPADAARW